jgi:hypothetical protein
VLLRGLDLNDITLFEFFDQLQGLRTASSINMSKNSRVRVMPRDTFNFSLLRIKHEFARVNLPFSARGPRAVIVAARMEMRPSEAGHSLPFERKLFTETYFTDPQTARLIQNVKSFTGMEFPQSAMNIETEVISDKSLEQAVRASIAEPLLTAPQRIDGQYYMGGAADLNPLDLARTLADEVIARSVTPFDERIAVPAIEATFGFNPNRVGARVTEVGVDRWIDVPEGTYPSLSPTAKFDLWGALINLNPGRLVKLSSLVPGTYAEYVKVFDHQYRKGYDGAFKVSRGERSVR